MDPQEAIDMGREALMTALMIGSPVLAVGVLVGLTIGLVQALTQIQDQTIAFVPKIVAMVVTVGFCLPWLVERMIEYSRGVILEIPRIVMGG